MSPKEGRITPERKTIDKEFLSHVLNEAYDFCTSSIDKKGQEIISEGEGFGDLVSDTEIRADKELGVFFAEEFKEYFSGLPFEIEIEGQGITKVNISENQDSRFYITVDPLDASLNFKSKGQTKGLPYSSSVSVFKNTNPKFEDCITAGVVDLRNGDLWVAEKNKGCFINGQPTKTNGKRKIDLKNGIIIGEFYYPENRQVLMKAFGKDKGWLRNPGSAAYEMSLVASGQADAYICDRQKSHELGAAYRMVTEAGGFACDFEGNELGDRNYDFNSQVPVILAASEELAREILSRL